MPSFCKLVLPVSEREPKFGQGCKKLALCSPPASSLQLCPPSLCSSHSGLPDMGRLLPPPTQNFLPTDVHHSLLPSFRSVTSLGRTTLFKIVTPFQNSSPFSALFFSTAVTTIQHMLHLSLVYCLSPPVFPSPLHVSSVRTRVCSRVYSQCLAHTAGTQKMSVK